MGDTRDFRLPDLGEGLEEADLLEWYVAVGDTVGLNDPLCQVETAKATVDVPSPFAGTVVSLVGDVGETLAVGEVFVRIDVGDTPPREAPSPEAPPRPGRSEAEASATTQPEAPLRPGRSEAEASATTQPRQPVLVGYGVAGDGPRRRRRRSGPAGPAGEGVGRALAKPTVRRLAKDHGIDLATLSPGSGPDGIVTRDDVEHAIARAGEAPPRAGRSDAEASATTQPDAEASATTQPDTPPRAGRSDAKASATTQPDTPPRAGRSDAKASATTQPDAEASATTQPGETIPLRGIRRSIADAMTLSRSTIPDAACGLTVDCTRLMRLRDHLREVHPELTPFALIARFTVAALGDHPRMNARIDADAGEIRLLDDIHLGIAVDTPNGLLVPVVSDAGARSTPDLASEMRRLALGARDRSLTPSQLMGSTFTISNFGAFGLEDGYPVINPPEAAILGVGAIVERPWVVDGALAVRHVARLTLVFDHRIADGAEGGRFLTDLAHLVEHPETIPVTA